MNSSSGENQTEQSPSESASPSDDKEIIHDEGGWLKRLLSARRKGDASRGEVMLYAFGNIEGGIANQFWNVLQQIMIIAMMVNPLMIGLVIGIKSLWDSITDPIMAHITDNSRTRWGRRRPYILVGGTTRIALLALIVMFFPIGSEMVSNKYLESDNFIKEAATNLERGREVFAQAYQFLAGELPESVAVGLTPAKIREVISSIVTSMETSRSRLPGAIETLQTTLAEREERLRELEALPGDNESPISIQRGVVERTREALAGASRSDEGLQNLLAVAPTLLQALDSPDPVDQTDLTRIHDTLAAVGVAVDPPKPEMDAEKTAPKPAKPGMWQSIALGYQAFMDPANAGQRKIIVFFLITFLLFTTLTTIQSVPYFAMGIELSPSYDGRTQVAVYRSVMDKALGIIGPWVPAFCFLLIFDNAMQGLFWVAVIAALVGIPSTVLMVMFTRERTQISTGKNRMNMFRSFYTVFKTPIFWRIFTLYQVIGITWGVFMQFGFFLNVYWVMGSALRGAALGGLIQSLAWALTFAALPVINWACQRYQKHLVLQFAVIWMGIGAFLQWFVVTPANPYLQLVLPFFTAVGISSFYVVMATLLADATDEDELRTGERREGMYAAVMSFCGKMIGALTPVIAGLMLVVSGFDARLEFNQTEETIFKMRLLYSFVPAVLLLTATALLWKYPLNRKRMAEIKAELKRRHAMESEAQNHA